MIPDPGKKNKKKKIMMNVAVDEMMNLKLRLIETMMTLLLAFGVRDSSDSASHNSYFMYYSLFHSFIYRNSLLFSLFCSLQTPAATQIFLC